MKISIITTTFQCVDTVTGCLKSVAGQSHADREHVVIDGASDDGTLAFLERAGGQLAVLESAPDRGIYFGLNKGIARATGEVIGVLHADDVYASDDVLAQVAEAFSEPGIQAVYGDLVYVSQDQPSRVIRHWQAGAFSSARLQWGWMPPHPTLFLRRAVYERLGGFDTRYRIAADYDFMLRVFKKLSPDQVAYLPQVLIRMRLGGASNHSLANIARKSREDYCALRSNGVGGPVTLFLKNARKLPQFWQRSSR
jgi:glycosyltransferase